MDLQEINEQYGRYIWAIANRYHTGVWDAEDVFNQILIGIHSAIISNKLNDGDENETVQRVHAFIITRAINIIRHENRRKCASMDIVEFNEPAATSSVYNTKFEISLIRELLFIRLDEQIAEFIFELAFPSDVTISIAVADQKEARKDKSLRMNVNQLKILPKHVVEFFKRINKKAPSPATISRWRTKAKDVIYEEGKEKDKKAIEIRISL